MGLSPDGTRSDAGECHAPVRVEGATLLCVEPSMGKWGKVPGGTVALAWSGLPWPTGDAWGSDGPAQSGYFVAKLDSSRAGSQARVYLLSGRHLNFHLGGAAGVHVLAGVGCYLDASFAKHFTYDWEGKPQGMERGQPLHDGV